MLLAGIPSNVTDVAPVKPEPVMVTVVPPFAVPPFGERAFTATGVSER